MSTENELVAKCPQCGSVFRLTPQHLQAAKGWVQCGMCGHVFHSGIKNAEEAPAENSAAPSPPVEAPAAPPAADQTETRPVPISEAPVSEAPAETAAAANGTDTHELSGLANRMAEQGVSSDFGPRLESIILLDPNVKAADDDYGPMPEIEVRANDSKSDKSKPAYPPATPPAGGWGARQDSTATSTGWIPRRSATRQPQETKKSRKLGWLWALLVLLLLLALGAQLLYSLRDKLAASHPELRPVLEAICEDLNCTLSLPRDTKQVLILGSDLQTEDGGNLALEVTLANRAAYAMAWPVLELTLTDVEDQPVARRMFAPSEYLPSSKMESAGIQARSEIPFNLQLQSKDLKAAGYRLRMFY